MDGTSTPHRPESARWAAILCILTAVVSVVGAAWSMYARSENDESFGAGKGLSAGVATALGRWDTVITVSAVLDVVLAVALVVGGILLRQRKRAGRAFVAAVSGAYLVATIAGYVVARQVWGGLLVALGETSDDYGYGAGLGSVLRSCLLGLLILGLALAPSTKRWLAGEDEAAERRSSS